MRNINFDDEWKIYFSFVFDYSVDWKRLEVIYWIALSDYAINESELSSKSHVRLSSVRDTPCMLCIMYVVSSSFQQNSWDRSPSHTWVNSLQHIIWPWTCPTSRMSRSVIIIDIYTFSHVHIYDVLLTHLHL